MLNSSFSERIGRTVFLFGCVCIFGFLVVPILVIVPLSFNSEPYFTYPMPSLSLRWYKSVLTSPDWQLAFRNSVLIGLTSMIAATVLGTTAALGLSRADFPLKGTAMAILMSPAAVPIVITAVGMYYLFARIGLSSTLVGLILAHTVLGAPFVVITVGATLTGMDRNLLKAAAGLGAGPWMIFFSVTLPLILPGIVSGAIFAFVASWDDLVVALLLVSVEQQTLPRRMFAGIRESLDPSLLAVATLLTLFSIALLVAIEIFRQRTSRV